jgi:hypothetical protein
MPRDLENNIDEDGKRFVILTGFNPGGPSA